MTPIPRVGSAIIQFRSSRREDAVAARDPRTHGLYFMYYNFARVHQTLGVTPAMEAGIEDHVWSVEEIVGLLK
jgi:hypothetical protein